MNPILSLLLWNIAQYLGFRVEDFIEFLKSSIETKSTWWPWWWWNQWLSNQITKTRQKHFRTTFIMTTFKRGEALQVGTSKIAYRVCKNTHIPANAHEDNEDNVGTVATLNFRCTFYSSSSEQCNFITARYIKHFKFLLIGADLFFSKSSWIFICYWGKDKGHSVSN